MAGTTDNPTPEKQTADALIGASTTPAPHSPDFNAEILAPNANKPGNAAPAAERQAASAAPPPGEASLALAAPPAAAPAGDARPAAPAAAPAPAGDARPAAPVPAPDAADRTRTNDAAAPDPLKHSMDVMTQVNAILDGDVPRLNKAHDLAGAQRAYEQAVALSKTLTAQEIATAQQQLVQVSQAKAKETDPTKQRDLANQEVSLYTITRLKDAALGNEALWFYRQGKTEDGNAKLMEACGIDPAKAQQLKKMGAPEAAEFVKTLQAGSEISPILGDVNFYRQINKITDSGSQVPAVFGKIHDLVLQHNQAAAANPGDAPAAPARPGDAPAAAAPVAYDNDKAQAAIDAFNTLTDQLKAKPGPLTDAQRQTLEAGTKALDDRNTFVGHVLDANGPALDKLLPGDKLTKFNKDIVAINSELVKIGNANTANPGHLPDALQTQVQAMWGSVGKPQEFQAATAALTKSQPDLVKLVQAAIADLPPGAQGVAAKAAYFRQASLQSTFVQTSKDQIEGHEKYAQILLNSKNPPDGKDVAHAKEVFAAGFTNAQKDVANAVFNQPAGQALAKVLGPANDASAAPGAAPAGSDKPAVPGAAPGTAPGATGLAALDGDALKAKLTDAKNKGAAGMNDAKALFEEAIRRAEDPEHKKAFTDALTANLTALETGKDASGKPLDAAARMDLHKTDIGLILALNAPAQLHSDYAMYLGDNRLALQDPKKFPYAAKYEDGINQLKSMDVQQRKAIEAADAVPIDLLKRADAQINADRKANIGDQTVLDQAKTMMENGYADGSGVHFSLVNMRVQQRDQLAALYLMEGRQFNADGSPMAQLTNQVPNHKTDEMFKPQYAYQLLTEARAANEAINGKGAVDTTTEKLYGIGSKMQPELFKANSDSLKQNNANVLSDMAAMTASVGGGMVARFIVAAASEGRMNPMLVNAIGNTAAVATGIGTRRYVHMKLSGQDESWGDTLVHGTAAALMPIGFKYTTEFLSNNKIAAAAFEARSANITGQSVVLRTAGTIGNDATFAQVAERFRASNLPEAADALAPLGTQKVSEATAEQMAGLNKAINLNGARGQEAFGRIFPNMHGGDGAILNGLEARGIKTVGDLDAELAGRATRVNNINTQLSTVAKESTSVTDALKAAKGADGVRLYPTQEAVEREAKFLAENKINTVGELRNASRNAGDYFSVKQLYPQLATAPPTTTIREVLASGPSFGPAASEGRIQLSNIVPESQLAPESAFRGRGLLGKAGNAIDGLFAKGKDFVWDNRWYKVGVEMPGVNFPNQPASALVAREANASQGAVGRFVSKYTPEVTGPRVSMPNLGRIDPAFSTPEQIAAAGSQSKYWKTVAGGLVSFGGYNTATFLNDNYFKGKQWQDQGGQWHTYTLPEALKAANFGAPDASLASGLLTGTVTQALLGGFILGKLAPEALEAVAAPAGRVSSYVMSKVPALSSPAMAAGRDAIAGSGLAASTFAAYGIYGNPKNFQVGLDYLQAWDKDGTYKSTQKPLVDYVPHDIGTAADAAAAAPAAPAPEAAPAAHAAPAPEAAPAAVHAGDAPVDPNTDSPTGAAAPGTDAAKPDRPAAAPAPAAARPAAAPAAPPAAASGVGAGLQAPDPTSE